MKLLEAYSKLPQLDKNQRRKYDFLLLTGTLIFTLVTLVAGVLMLTFCIHPKMNHKSEKCLKHVSGPIYCHNFGFGKIDCHTGGFNSSGTLRIPKSSNLTVNANVLEKNSDDFNFTEVTNGSKINSGDFNVTNSGHFNFTVNTNESQSSTGTELTNGSATNSGDFNLTNVGHLNLTGNTHESQSSTEDLSLTKVTNGSATKSGDFNLTNVGHLNLTVNTNASQSSTEDLSFTKVTNGSKTNSGDFNLTNVGHLNAAVNTNESQSSEEFSFTENTNGLDVSVPCVDEPENQDLQLNPMIYSAAVLFILSTITTFVLVAGLYTKRANYLLPFLTSALVVALCVLLVLLMRSFFADELRTEERVAMVVLIFTVVMCIYCLVGSFYFVLRESSTKKTSTASPIKHGIKVKYIETASDQATLPSA